MQQDVPLTAETDRQAEVGLLKRRRFDSAGTLAPISLSRYYSSILSFSKKL